MADVFVYRNNGLQLHLSLGREVARLVADFRTVSFGFAIGELSGSRSLLSFGSAVLYLGSAYSGQMAKLASGHVSYRPVGWLGPPPVSNHVCGNCTRSCTALFPARNQASVSIPVHACVGSWRAGVDNSSTLSGGLESSGASRTSGYVQPEKRSEEHLAFQC